MSAKTTVVVNGDDRPLINTIREAEKAIEGMKQKAKTVTIGGDGPTRQVDQYVDGLGRVVTITQIANEETGNLETSIVRVKDTLNRDDKKSGGFLDTLTKRFTAANIASTLITTAISKVRQQVHEAVNELKEMDKQLTTIKMVTGASDSDIANLRQNAYAGAMQTGREVTDYLSASERFARAGYRDNIEDLTKLSLVTQNVGGVTEDVASKFILAADAAWKYGGDTEKLWALLDGVSNVADKHATDLGKIAEGITVAGSAMANAGEDAATFTAMLAATTTSTQRSGSEMARGLRTILYRIRQVKGELDDGEIISADDISNAAKALDRVGISVLDDTNHIKSMSDILGELAEKWDELDDVSKYGVGAKENLQYHLAGNRQGNVLFALMDNWDVVQQMIGEFENSAGTALEKNAQYTESWAAATANLKTAWTNLMGTFTADGGWIQKVVEWLGTTIDDFNRFVSPEYNKARIEGMIGKAGEAAEEASDGIKMYTDDVEAAGEASEEAAGYVSELGKAFSDAETNIKNVSDALKTEKDDAIKSVADIYKAFQSAEEKGYYGSNAFTQGANFFFGTTDRSAIGASAKSALSAYFDEITNGDYANAAANLWGKITEGANDVVDANGEVIASMRDTGDTYEWAFNKGEQSISGFLSTLESSTGIGADFWASFIKSLGMYTEEIDNWIDTNDDFSIKPEVDTEEAVSSVNALTELIASIPDRTVKINVVTAYNNAGGGSSGLEAAKSQYTAYNYWSGYGDYLKNKKYAGGKLDNYSGPALVNDEAPANGTKPELIISRSTGDAYIANKGRPAIVNLNSDDIVLTAKQTKDAVGIPHFKVGKNNQAVDLGLLLDGGGYSDGKGKSMTAVIEESASEVVATIEKTGKDNGSGGSGGGKKQASAKEVSSALEDYMEKLLEKAQDALDEQLETINAQIFQLRYQREMEEKATALEEARLNLLKAQQDLVDAQTERTVRYFNQETGQWEWMADQKAVLKAQESLADAQKKYLEEQYKYLETTWSDIKKSITEALEGKKVLTEQELIDLLKNSAAKGLVPDVESLIAAIAAFVSDPSGGTDLGSFDSGGFAFGKGLLRKAISEGETVLDANTTKKILDPKSNAQFAEFTESLGALFGMSTGDAGAKPQNILQSIVNSTTGDSSTNYYISGIKLGSDMADQPLSRILSVLPIYAG